MRVLVVLPGVNPSAGAERSFAVLAPELVAGGVRLHLAVLTERQGLVPDLERAGVVIHDLSAARGLRGRVGALGEVIRAVGPDLVHASLWEAALPAQLAARRASVPVLVTWAAVGYTSGHGGAASWKLVALRRFDGLVARASHTWFHAVTPGVAEANAALLGVSRDRVRVVERGRPEPPPVDAAEVAALRASLGLGPDHRVVLAVGRQEPVKDHAMLVRAVDLTSRPVPGVRLLLAGRDGSASASLRQVIDGSAVADRVQLLGQRDDVPELMALADVVACSSRSEGAAGAVIEAMAGGVPVVSTDVVGQRGILEDDVNSLVVPVGDERAMAAALERVLGEPALAARLGRAGRTTFEERFTIDRSGEGMVALFREVSGSGRGHG